MGVLIRVRVRKIWNVFSGMNPVTGQGYGYGAVGLGLQQGRGRVYLQGS